MSDQELQAVQGDRITELVRAVEDVLRFVDHQGYFHQNTDHRKSLLLLRAALAQV